MFWKYLVAIRSEACLILFWEYINANLFAVRNVRSCTSIIRRCSHMVRHALYVQPVRNLSTVRRALSKSMQSGAWNVETGTSIPFVKPGRVVSRVSGTWNVEPDIQYVDPGVFLKVFIVRPLEFGCVTWLIWSGIINWRPGKVFFFNFNDTISREEHKTIYSGFRIIGMSMSNQSELPAFCNPWQVNLKSTSYHILPNPTIPDDDLPRLAWSRKMTSREWPNPIKWHTICIEVQYLLSGSPAHPNSQQVKLGSEGAIQ